ncbi:hypothetical protein CASFOL_015930 [Castilleja foliolosa]|uniref:Pentatricopeptide repeat-containing protein n=1 Tax=Castilleja foliolosa TaxID=1961234 RepID=A0ABD3DG18_9LAMI
MSKLRPEYYSNLRKSLKMALGPSSIPTIHPSINYDVVSANKAITSSCQIGDIHHARHLFDSMPQRTVVSWNTMITGYSKQSMLPESLALISLMHHSSAKLNEVTFSISLSVCGRLCSLIKGNQVHCLVLKTGHKRFKHVGSALLYLHANCRRIGDARKVFDELTDENELLWSSMLMGYVESDLISDALELFDKMPTRGVVEWTTLISGFVKSEGCKKALELFKTMRETDCDAVPNEFTFDCLLRGCGELGDLSSGRAIHGLILKSGFECDHSIKGALVFLYCRCGYMDEAKIAYDNMSEMNPISCNLMIKGYAMCGRFEDSKRLFTEMPVKILSSLNAMISVYAKNGEIEKSLELFETAKEEESPVTWNSIISGFIQNDCHEDALRLYLDMRRSSISPTRSTFSVLLHSCACLGSLQQGRLLHAHLSKSPSNKNVYVGTSLIDMYSKCGCISDANTAFKYMNAPNVAAWTALINGHAHHGLGPDAISLFNLMLQNEVAPNAATFVAVLSGCARAGLVDTGMRLFRSMEEDYNIPPTLEHLTCVVDLLGRSGLLREAEEIIESTRIEVDEILLISLLHASWFWMDVEMGERVVEKMYAMGPRRFSSACVIMSNMYSRSGKWREKMEVRDSLKEFGGKKDPGCSWIDVNNTTHVFCVDYRKHPDSNAIYANLESLNVNTHYTNEFDFFSLYS